MQCREFREIADSYLSDELLVETNHDMIAHLESCAECRRELTARRELRATLRASFVNAEELRMRDEFAAGLRTELHIVATTEAPSLISRRMWIAIAACLLVAAAFGLVAWQRQRARAPAQIAVVEPDKPNAASVKPTDVQPRPAPTAVDADMVLAKMSELAAGDHRDCAINHRLPESPINLEEAGRKYDPAYLNLTKAVMSIAGDSTEKWELVMVHSCVFNGQRFAHIVLRRRGRLASLLVTRLEQSGDLVAKEKPAEAGQYGQVIACSAAAGYQISCFRTAGHAVFVVSDMGERENLALARELAPSVYEHIMRAENVI